MTGGNSPLGDTGRSERPTWNPADPIETWLAIGLANRWIRWACDPPFTRRSFTQCSDAAELSISLGAAVDAESKPSQVPGTFQARQMLASYPDCPATHDSIPTMGAAPEGGFGAAPPGTRSFGLFIPYAVQLARE
jgi:hypothetical protein